MNLEFLPIDLSHHTAVCIQFAEDMQVYNFGSAAQFHGSDGKGAERYIERLRAQLSADPESGLHVWQDSEIVGQLILGRFIDLSIGYISVFYVIPAERGRQVANVMEAYAADWFRKRGFASARLSVAPTNVRAMRFYRRHGWEDLGARADKPELHNMEKVFP